MPLPSKTALALLTPFAIALAGAGCGAPSPESEEAASAALSPEAAWDVAFTKPAPELSFGAYPTAIVSDSTMPNHVFWLASNRTVELSVQSPYGWTAPLDLQGTLAGIAAARSSVSQHKPGSPSVQTTDYECLVGIDPFHNETWLNDAVGDVTNAASWSGWFTVSGYAENDQPAVVMVGPAAYVFIVGGNRQIWTIEVDVALNEVLAGWAQLPALPGGAEVVLGNFDRTLSAALRGGSTIDLAVVVSGGNGKPSQIWHMPYALAPRSGAWEETPSWSNNADTVSVSVASTDADTVEILETTGGEPVIVASPSPGSWIILPTPQGTSPTGAGSCGSVVNSTLVSSAPGEMDFYETSQSGTLYADHYGPTPSSTPGVTFCH